MKTANKSIFLADDDIDDRLLFEDALREICKDTRLTTAANGRELMNILEETVPPPPNVIFLDLNMPLKNGFECLTEIRATDEYKDIPVVIFSTSSEKEHINKVYEQGADYYVCKPDSFPKLKQAISKVLSINWDTQATRATRDQFLLCF